MAVILTEQQKKVLQLLAQTSLANNFYFSGGTALSHYYLQHRLSEDLDFFNEEEFDPQEITMTIKTLQSKLGFEKFDFQQSFNRNLYFLYFPNDYILKLEFTYYPFHQVEEPILKDGLRIDSVIDIAVNKVFTIVQKPRGRDYFDLFWMMKKYHFALSQLRMLAKQKFDWHIDPLQLASKLHEVINHIDDPILVKKIEKATIISFFQKEAKKMSPEIIQMKNK